MLQFGGYFIKYSHNHYYGMAIYTSLDYNIDIQSMLLTLQVNVTKFAIMCLLCFKQAYKIFICNYCSFWPGSCMHIRNYYAVTITVACK